MLFWDGLVFIATRGKTKGKLGVVVVSYSVKGGIARIIFPLRRRLKPGRRKSDRFQKEDDHALQMVSSPSKTRKITVPSEKIDIQELKKELLKYYPQLLAFQVQLNDGFETWVNSSIAQENLNDVIVGELATFPRDAKIEIRK